MTPAAQTPAIVRHGPGTYSTADGRFEIIRTEWMGPAGGRRYVWEIAIPTPSGAIIADHPPFETKRETVEYVKGLYR
jgi:hypothetical protein